ncbi:DNA-3-methyladenine glycosylase family protein [Isachenkonia alkalipeptolytica]|uniref:DNA-(apurinic or apyrimidinic site) lyase n=1 Tax=Isachenkonia alkalipeptolytica TaxID=2565777 RepID=A0AA43XJU3_9CLOT|nr:DNA glycosylase [Isachenkonia alkalipeptolytica]NBG87504.1 8-oxoguanine DNA glycosylase [Isachenkonia alkalipeptolytica]
MKGLNLIEKGSRVEVLNLSSFNPRDIFRCGQAFRWEEKEDNRFLLTACQRVIEVEKSGDRILFHNTDLRDFERIWWDYFDLDTDYERIQKRLIRRDPVMEEAVTFGRGIRILKQEPFETLISFIISSNNNIKRIKGSVEGLARKYGEVIQRYDGKLHYAFPTPGALSSATLEELKLLGLGYRARYVKDTAEQVSKNPGILDTMIGKKRRECLAGVTGFSGVGPKVGNCVVFFSMGKREAFPVDVWVKRMMEALYFQQDKPAKEIEDFAMKKFGKDAGYAQQYLFYYAREKGIK